MHIRLTALSFAIAAATVMTGGAATDHAMAGGRIIQVNTQDTSSHGGRIKHLDTQVKSSFGGRILKISPQQANAGDEDAPVKFVTPRYPILRPVVEDGYFSDKQLDGPGVDQRSDAHRFKDVPPHITINQYYGTPCYSGSSLNFRAGDQFQAGGNLLRVPHAEAAFGRHACNKTRIYQRYLGFKRVYKGQVYTGFRKVYSGRKYLNGNY